jgi:hypothetical protein
MCDAKIPSPSGGQTYSPEQMGMYFDHIMLADKWRYHPICIESREPGTLSHSQAFEFLEVLQAHQISAVPFENLHLHYSPHKTIDISKESVFNKIVAKASGRGGYCMENNTLFFVVLKTLGFDVFLTGARVNSATQPNGTKGEEEKYKGWSVPKSHP